MFASPNLKISSSTSGSAIVLVAKTVLVELALKGTTSRELGVARGVDCICIMLGSPAGEEIIDELGEDSMFRFSSNGDGARTN